MGDQENRDKKERIARLKRRLDRAKQECPDDPVIGILAGILHLLDDEL